MKKKVITIIIILILIIIGGALLSYKNKNKTNTDTKNTTNTVSTEKPISDSLSALFKDGYKGSSKLEVKTLNNEEIYISNINFNGTSELIHETFTSNKSSNASEIIYSFKDDILYLNNNKKYSKCPKDYLGSISVINLNEINNALLTLKNDLKVDYINEKYETTFKNLTSSNILFKTFLPYSDINDFNSVKDISFKLTFNKEKLLESESFSFVFILDNVEYKLNYIMTIESSNETIAIPTE